MSAPSFDRFFQGQDMNLIVKGPPDPDEGRQLRREEGVQLLKMTQSGIYFAVTPQSFEKLKSPARAQNRGANQAGVVPAPRRYECEEEFPDQETTVEH